MTKVVSLTFMCLCLMVVPAFAHVGVGAVDTFNYGFLHPFKGVDHLLAMVAVGLYAASLGGAALWLVPMAFVGTVIFGGILGSQGFPLPFVEAGIGASVVAMGLAIAVGVRLSTMAAMALVGLLLYSMGTLTAAKELGLPCRSCRMPPASSSPQHRSTWLASRLDLASIASVTHRPKSCDGAPEQSVRS